MNKPNVQFLCTKFIKSISAIVLATGLLLPVTSHAMDEASLGYQYDTQGNVLRDAKGNCLRSSQWSPTNAIAACDPRVVEQRSGEVPVREKKGKLVSEAGVTEITTGVDILVLQAGKEFDFNSAEVSAAGNYDEQLSANCLVHYGCFAGMRWQIK